jgi:hypothetical protein
MEEINKIIYGGQKKVRNKGEDTERQKQRQRER